MKKLTKILMMLVVALMLASCGSKSEPDPDDLMTEILVAGRYGHGDRAQALEKILLEQKMTINQARRYIFEIEPKTALLVYEGGGWNEDGFFCDNWDIDGDCRQVLREITEEQIRISRGVY